MIDLAGDLDYPEQRSAPRPLVIFHMPCMDGFTAAWAMWLKYPDAEFIHGVHGQPPPDVKGRDVYLLDFSYKREVMRCIMDDAMDVTILDHHRSAEADLEGIFTDFKLTGGEIAAANGRFDMEKSGARLAWEWFHPGVEVPLFVRLVEDRDLWRFAIPDSKALNATFFSYDYDFLKWNAIREACEDNERFLGLLAGGCAIERKHDKDVKELVSKLRHFRKFKHAAGVNGEVLYIPCANLPYTMSSDAAGLMAERAPFAATYYQDCSGQYVFSLRSRNGGLDVSAIASRYGGGGHRNAAGFRVASLEAL